jgi:predicted Zn-ribbon and HTH transcriptional regulator
MVTQKMLEAAMVEAVKRGMFPKDAPANQYITAWEDMRAVLEAAQPRVQSDVCQSCGLKSTDGANSIERQSYCPHCGTRR